ncbi:MAG: adenylate/guanylate cyclase domain-containing protein [Rhabdochlamydiaceae bacterium]
MDAKTFFKHKWKYRRLEIDILGAFSFLFLATAVLVIWFTFLSSYKVISESAKDIIELVSDRIVYRTKKLIHSKENLLEITAPLIQSTDEINLNNVKLLDYMYQFIKTIDYGDQIYIGTKEGKFLEVLKIEKENREYFVNRNIPKSTYAAIRMVEQVAEGSKESWIFKDKEFNTIDSVDIQNTFFDPRQRPWYNGALESKNFFWSEPYTFNESAEQGITVSKKIINKNGEVLGVLATDLYLKTISSFLSNETSIREGEAIITTREGTVLAASHPLGLSLGENVLSSSQSKKKVFSIYDLDESLMEISYKHSLIQKEQTFIIEYKDKEYFSLFKPFLYEGQQEWLIGLSMPFYLYLEKEIQDYHRLILILIVIFFISVCFIYLIAKRIAKPIVSLSKEIDKITHFHLNSKISITSHIKEIFMISRSVSRMREVIREFSHFVPKELVQKLMIEGKSLELGGEKKMMTIFFSDIYGFTSISEKMPAEQLMLHLSEYISVLSDIILHNNGTIDKYAGDNIMAIWGAPSLDEKQSVHACSAALLCQQKLAELNEKWLKEGKPVLKTRIGIHRGESIVGNIGNAERLNYTVVGDPVNVASALEYINKKYRTEIIISEEIVMSIGSQFLYRPVDIVKLPGKSQGIKIFELIDKLKGSQLKSPQLRFIKRFTKAFDLFYEGEYKKAFELFKEVAKLNQDDHITMMYIQRCQKYLRSRKK